ncbi:hypothetical protein [Loigolactobacillus jiayinensis]|uniref:Uncharacterized protein n=1 Tax=Loigolactobacillus jiayinensis TaxID=2486016 RepID=A0ABW1RDZ3_9LACO|nr:hypothetical protein [Loigolactobacillus jiayinensis]
MMKLAKRFIFIVLLIIQLILLWLPIELQNLYDTHLGFMRQILFMNETYPVHLAKWLFWIVIFSAVSLLILSFGHRNKGFNWLQLGWLAILLLVTLSAVLMTATSAPLYFYNLTCWGISVLLQIVIVMADRIKLQ